MRHENSTRENTREFALEPGTSNYHGNTKYDLAMTAGKPGVFERRAKQARCEKFRGGRQSTETDRGCGNTQHNRCGYDNKQRRKTRARNDSFYNDPFIFELKCKLKSTFVKQIFDKLPK